MWRSWGPLGPYWGPPVDVLGLSWEPFGTLWVLSWAVLGFSWAVLEPSWAVLGASWAVMGASWAVLDAVQTKEANILKMYVFPREWDSFCFLGALWGASWSVLRASVAVLKPSWALLERSWAVAQFRFGWRATWEPFGGLLARLGAFWGSWPPPGGARSPEEAPKRAKSPPKGSHVACQPQRN